MKRYATTHTLSPDRWWVGGLVYVNSIKMADIGNVSERCWTQRKNANSQRILLATVTVCCLTFDIRFASVCAHRWYRFARPWNFLHNFPFDEIQFVEQITHITSQLNWMTNIASHRWAGGLRLMIEVIFNSPTRWREREGEGGRKEENRRKKQK